VRFSSFALGVTLIGFVAAFAAPPAGAVVPSSDGLALLAGVVAGRDDAVVTRFDPRLRATLDAAGLKAAWTKYRNLFGSYVSHGQPRETALGTLTVVRVPLEMKRRPGEFRVTFDAEGRVAGLYFLKTNVPL
jgi:hypothetical protein